MQKMPKTYNSRDSLLVNHAITNLPVRSFNMGERTGPLVLSDLWSYVKDTGLNILYKGHCDPSTSVKNETVGCIGRIFSAASLLASATMPKHILSSH